jgi:hypothetical protein
MEGLTIYNFMLITIWPKHWVLFIYEEMRRSWYFRKGANSFQGIPKLRHECVVFWILHECFVITLIPKSAEMNIVIQLWVCKNLDWTHQGFSACFGILLPLTSLIGKRAILLIMGAEFRNLNICTCEVVILLSAINVDIIDRNACAAHKHILIDVVATHSIRRSASAYALCPGAVWRSSLWHFSSPEKPPPSARACPLSRPWDVRRFGGK